MTEKERSLSPVSTSKEVDQFLKRVAATPVTKPAGTTGRLIFAMDATASRQHTWDTACQLQGEMFTNTSALGGLDVQLCYYRGFGEFRAGPWHGDSSALLGEMTAVDCRGGLTQLERVLRHSLAENQRQRIQGLVFVGDAMEEPLDRLCHHAGQLGMLNIPVFVFQEGRDPTATAAFQQIARLSKGAHCHFDRTSAKQLQALLSAVAVFAAGGRPALENFGKSAGKEVQRLLQQLK